MDPDLIYGFTTGLTAGLLIYNAGRFVFENYIFPSVDESVKSFLKSESLGDRKALQLEAAGFPRQVPKHLNNPAILRFDHPSALEDRE